MGFPLLRPMFGMGSNLRSGPSRHTKIFHAYRKHTFIQKEKGKGDGGENKGETFEEPLLPVSPERRANRPHPQPLSQRRWERRSALTQRRGDRRIGPHPNPLPAGEGTGVSFISFLGAVRARGPLR